MLEILRGASSARKSDRGNSQPQIAAGDQVWARTQREYSSSTDRLAELARASTLVHWVRNERCKSAVGLCCVFWIADWLTSIYAAVVVIANTVITRYHDVAYGDIPLRTINPG